MAASMVWKSYSEHFRLKEKCFININFNFQLNKRVYLQTYIIDVCELILKPCLDPGNSSKPSDEFLLSY